MDLENRLAELEKTTASLMEIVKAFSSALSDGFGKVNGNFDKITIHFNKIEKEIAVINAKIDKLDGNTTVSLGKVGDKLDDLKTEIQKINNVTGYKDMFDNLKNLGGGQA